LHPWIFTDDVVASGSAEHGDLVRVHDTARAFLGIAFFSARSKIALRFVSRSDVAPDRAFWFSRVAEALARRGREVARWSARRLLFAEGDGVPGLIVDLYGTHLVFQALTVGAERVVPDVLAAIGERLPVDSVLARNDPSVRTLEGLAREVRQVSGQTPAEIVIDEEGVRFAVDPWRGQKTGAFLDQRENRLASRRYAHGRVLDVFAYQGSFALHAATAAVEVTVVDSSSSAMTAARANAERNAATNLTFVEANAFEDLRLRERRGERFDLVLLDPPAFAKSRGDVPAARRGYKELNLRALRLLAPGGVLMTSSCSYHLDEPAFAGLLREAADDAGVQALVLERRGQAADHPVRLAFPEGRYLKCHVLRETS
jgi:23S rRNA (cytosine1962-C5)-methyltransferase